MAAYITITLVIPSFNRADLIVETIESALNQTRPFAEIIVVDDASTDNTLDRLRQFEGRISVIASEKVGVQSARNKGVDAATTQYVTLCDSDDLLAPNFVDVVSSWLAQNAKCDSLYSNFVTFNDTSTDPDKFSMAPKGFFEGSVQNGNFLSDIPDLYGKTVAFQPLFSSGVTIKKIFYESIGGYNQAFNGVGSEDWEYTLRAIQAGKTSICTLPLVKIRRHSGNDSFNKIRMSLGEVTVLEHALKYHEAAIKYSKIIEDSINKRRIQAFEVAFGLKQYDTAILILPSIAKSPRNIKFRIKIFFTRIIRLKRLGTRLIILKPISQQQN